MMRVVGHLEVFAGRGHIMKRQKKTVAELKKSRISKSPAQNTVKRSAR